MTSTSAAEQSGASRRGLLARCPWHPPRRDDHPRETTSGEGVVLGSKRAEQMIADRKESLDRTQRSPTHLGGLAPRAKGGLGSIHRDAESHSRKAGGHACGE